ncbi:LysR substrate-binding domain protein [Bordetella bronchiseptica MBORD678]|uniref:LysR family transcriptional regulator n=1 Tax=Bordetella bronchiseptica TaxID=518 RepID=UPI0004A0924C|nr:LysR family transcriptional regulator [Bordetella bronchiseptica]KAB1448874.1 LysR family transcriptional regulator [Bordetella bronchiseptica]KAB1575135.1 LysR family transcriptional regulator [Bordetella bronchiseptica]KDB62381.1 LysR substrate-binding domain protein [Bordetella bronchiseptica A1-7]KDB73410.1 LysR substrate-binding domain protein [Bordetella bronchiseptica B20-10725633]KDD94168.1 LysR substrate-binding domain protein [Bordetella bronchiseptica MBORD678]
MDLLDPDLNRLASRLRFRHFQLLLTLAREGSLRAAAQEMHVTQPALSRMLEEIEGVLGVQLFVRTSRGLSPTGHGIAATRSARQILEELGRVPQEINLGPQVAALIRIGAPHFVAHSVMPRVISRLAALRPRVHVQLIERPVPELFAALQEGDADALVTTYAPQHIEAVKMPLHQEKLYESNYQLVAPPDHRFAKSRRPVPLAKLVNEDWILPAQDSMLRKEIDWVFRRAGLLPPVPVVEANNPTTSIQLVVAGIGLGFAHGETLQNVPPGTVAPIRISPSPASAQVALVYRAKRMNEKIQALRAALGL